MTVRELKEKLEHFDENRTIYIEIDGQELEDISIEEIMDSDGVWIFIDDEFDDRDETEIIDNRLLHVVVNNEHNLPNYQSCN